MSAVVKPVLLVMGSLVWQVSVPLVLFVTRIKNASVLTESIANAKPGSLKMTMELVLTQMSVLLPLAAQRTLFVRTTKAATHVNARLDTVA